MKSTKDTIKHELLARMSNNLSSIQLYELENELTKLLFDYDISEKKNQMIVYENSNYSLLQKFLVSKSIEGMSKKSLEGYELSVRMYIESISKPIGEVETDDVRLYLSNYKTTRNVSNTTLDNMRRKLNSFFQWLTDEDYITKNPMRRIVKIKNDTFEEKAFSNTDEEKMRIVCTNARDRALIEFLDCTGCRVSEVASIDIADLDFHNLNFNVVGKGNKMRVAYFTDKCAFYLKMYLDSRTDNNPALFISLRGNKRMTKESIEDTVRKIGKRASVSNCHPHRFRRTLCCNLIDKGVDIQIVQHILGHSSIRTTMIYYNENQKLVESAYRSAIS